LILFDPAIIGRDLSGRVVGWSLGAERLLGYCQAEILGASADRLVAPEAREQEAAHLSRVARGDRVAPYTTVRLHKDGRRIPVSVARS
jgi:PAS domain S-box-containing protein